MYDNPNKIKYIPKAAWARFVKTGQLKFYKKRITNTNTVYDFFIDLLPGKLYPRAHLIAMQSHKQSSRFIKVDIHVDYERHKTDCFHPAVDKLYKTLHSC